MHSDGLDFDISIKDLSKIEGHTDLDIEVRDGQVRSCKLRINESKRFFTNAALGKPALGLHQVMSRICGTCSIAHSICCIGAVENALAIEPSEQTTMLRDLLLYGLNIRDHAMHLYLFCLPDILGKDSVLDFDDEGYEHELLHMALGIKAVGNALSSAVGGRAVHSPFPQVGGFMRLPDKKTLRGVAARLREARGAAMEFADIFLEKDFSFKSKTDYIALQNDRFSYLDGYLSSSAGVCIGRKHFRSHLEKMVIPYSQAPAFKYAGAPYMVGALSRMNVNKDTLEGGTRKDLGKHLKAFPSDDVFRNNLAQAIEVVHCIDSSLDLLERLDLQEEKRKVVKPFKSVGVNAIEAPRGTLYYKLDIDDSGRISAADLVIPTSQNQLKMNRDIAALVQKLIEEGKSQPEIEAGIERLIRAYDPCMSCATHFLKLNWKGERPAHLRP